MDKNNKRIEFIDVAKGLGIILVVLGHLNSAEQPIRNFIYSFHMPLFFILSGMFFEENTDFKTLLTKSIKTLLVPYIIFLVLDAAIYMAMHDFETESVIFSVQTRLISLTGIRLRITNLPIWFLFALFYIKIMYYFIGKNKCVEMIFIIVSICLVAVAKYFWYPPKCMYIVALPCMVFYILGRKLKWYILKLDEIEFNIKNIMLFTLMAVSLYVASNVNDCVNIYSYKYGNGAMFFFNGILGSILVAVLSVWFSRTKYISKILTYYGKNSVIVMTCHYYLCRIALPKFMNMFGMSQYLYNYITQIIVLGMVLIIMVPLIFISNRYLRFVFGKKCKGR